MDSCEDKKRIRILLFESERRLQELSHKNRNFYYCHCRLHCYTNLMVVASKLSRYSTINTVSRIYPSLIQHLSVGNYIAISYVFALVIGYHLAGLFQNQPKKAGPVGTSQQLYKLVLARNYGIRVQHIHQDVIETADVG